MPATGGIPVNFPRCTSQKGAAGHLKNAQKPARAFFGPQGYPARGVITPLALAALDRVGMMRTVFAMALVLFAATRAGAQDLNSANHRMEGCRAAIGDRTTYSSGYCSGTFASNHVPAGRSTLQAAQ